MYFPEGKSFILLKTKHLGIFQASFKSWERKIELFRCISAHISTAILSRQNGNRPVIYFFSLSALSVFQKDQLTTIHVSPCLHFHLLVHWFTRVQRAAFSSEKWLKEQKRKIEKGQGVWSRAEPYPSDIKAYSDPWNTIKPAPLAPLGQAAK